MRAPYEEYKLIDLLPAFTAAPDLSRLYHCDALTLLRAMPTHSVDLIATDPPYMNVKAHAWDRQWKSRADFLAWMDAHLIEMVRVLKPNGSLYLFCWPKMAAHIELLIAARMNVLNRITWVKPAYSTKAEMFTKDDLRTYFPTSETVFFAEQYGADGYALGESAYARETDKLRGFVFEPLRAYLDGERVRAGFTKPQVDAAWCAFKRVSQTAQSQKWFSPSCWNLPTIEAYAWLRELFNARGGDYLRREYDDLRREYDDLRAEFEELRRPFFARPDAPYTDVWTFPTVSTYPGKHPAEKPLEMMRHIVTISSKPDAVVLDPFAGGGTTLAAAKLEGRQYIGCDLDWAYVQRARKRIEGGTVRTRKPRAIPLTQIPLFQEVAG
jgi:adenine-specific DNA-methyltransferase